MAEMYEPKYAVGQIIVMFNEHMQTEVGPISIDPNKYYKVKGEIIKNLGYGLLEDDLEYLPGYDLIKVPEGQELAAVERIRAIKNIFQDAERRDLRLEERIKALEDLEAKALDLCEACDQMPKGEYLRNIDEIIELVEKAKEAS